MADHRDPQNAGPAPPAPKTSRPSQDENFPGQPPIVDIDNPTGEPQRSPLPSQYANKESPGDRGEGDHIESAEHVERELPSGSTRRDR